MRRVSIFGVVLNFDAVREILSGSKRCMSDFSWVSNRSILEFLCVKTQVYGSNASPDSLSQSKALLLGHLGLQALLSTPRQHKQILAVQSLFMDNQPATVIDYEGQK